MPPEKKFVSFRTAPFSLCQYCWQKLPEAAHCLSGVRTLKPVSVHLFLTGLFINAGFSNGGEGHVG
jgi:hypothetical protein